MSDTALSYLISLGIIGAGIAWIITDRDSATSAIWIAIGILTLAVGLWSLVTQMRRRTD